MMPQHCINLVSWEEARAKLRDPGYAGKIAIVLLGVACALVTGSIVIAGIWFPDFLTMVGHLAGALGSLLAAVIALQVAAIYRRMLEVEEEAIRLRKPILRLGPVLIFTHGKASVVAPMRDEFRVEIYNDGEIPAVIKNAYILARNTDDIAPVWLPVSLVPRTVTEKKAKLDRHERLVIPSYDSAVCDAFCEGLSELDAREIRLIVRPVSGEKGEIYIKPSEKVRVS